MIYILGEDNWKRDIAVGTGTTCNPLPERFGYHHPNDDGQSVFLTCLQSLTSSKNAGFYADAVSAS